MSNRSTPDRTPADYTDWPIRNMKPEQYEWVGVPETSDGKLMVWETETKRLIEVEPDRTDQVLDRVPDSGTELVEGEGLGERLESLADEHGWDWLSAFAREHLESGESAEASSG
ncbi:MAG: hypothetical protein ABEJ42_09320 [Halobacteriaceae archaeon]